MKTSNKIDVYHHIFPTRTVETSLKHMKKNGIQIATFRSPPPTGKNPSVPCRSGSYRVRHRPVHRQTVCHLGKEPGQRRRFQRRGIQKNVVWELS